MSEATIADWEAAKARLTGAKDAWSDYSGNNPDKGAVERGRLQQAVEAIEASLKDQGLLPRISHEELEHRLDAAFPGARSKQVVQFEGGSYQRYFSPSGRSRSGKTVTGWNRGWSPA